MQKEKVEIGSKEEDSIITVGLGIAIALTLLLIIIGAFVVQIAPQLPESIKGIKKLGEVGDFVGGILNPIISGCTLAVAVMVWQLQKKELKETQIALNSQATTAEQQRSEQRFFDLLNIYKEVISNFSITIKSIKLTGKDAIEKIPHISNSSDYMYFVKGFDYIQLMVRLGRMSYDEYKNVKIGVSGKECWNEFIPDKRTYLRVIFTIIKDIEQLLKNDHWYYGKIFRSQLSGGEVALLTLSLLFDEKGQTMRPLAAKYGLLKHLPANALRKYAEQELPSLCFGRKWAAAHPAMSSEETQPC